MDDRTDQAVELFEHALGARAQGDWARAEQLCLAAIGIFQEVEGESSPDAANLLNALTHWREERSDYQGAIDAAERATAILDALGEDFSGEDAAHLRIEALSNLGNLHRQLARYPEAETILKRALALAIETFGEASDEASNARNNLGILYKYTGKFQEAKILYETALKDIEAQAGVEHISTASLYHNLGGLEHARGNFAAGEAPARKAWEIRRKHLGENHPDALADAVAYAGVLDGLERYDESEKIYRDVLVQYERIYGAEHYEIAAVLNNLGNVRYALGDYAEAEALMRRTLALKEKLLGVEHPDTALSMNNLGVLLQAQGKGKEARGLFQRALEIFRSSLGDQHPQTQMARENLQELK